MNKTMMTGLLALLVIGIAAAGLVTAYRGDYSVKGPDYTPERHEAMATAFSEGDYHTWYGLMTAQGRSPRVTTVVTESNFAEFVRAHEAAQSGDWETAAAIRGELGLYDGKGLKEGNGHMAGKRDANRNTECTGECVGMMKNGNRRR